LVLQQLPDEQVVLLEAVVQLLAEMETLV